MHMHSTLIEAQRLPASCFTRATAALTCDLCEEQPDYYLDAAGGGHLLCEDCLHQLTTECMEMAHA